MEYKVLKGNIYRNDNYSIIPLRKTDLMIIKDWRNSQINILRQKDYLSNCDQEQYYQKEILPTFSQDKPLQILFSYLLNDLLIGYGGMTRIDWQASRAEISYLVDPARSVSNEIYTEDFGIFLDMMKRVAFEELNLNRIFSETYDIRPVHIRVIEKSNFHIEGRMKQHVFIDGNYVDSLIHGYLKEYYRADL